MNVPIPHPTWPLTSLGPPVSRELGASSLNEQRSRSPLLYVCWGPYISWCMLAVWWSSVWEISGVQNNWDCWSSYMITLLLSFFQPSLIQQQGLGANIYIWLSCLLGLSSKRHDIFPLCEQSIVSIIVLALGKYPWAVFHFGPVARPSFPQASLHFHPCFLSDRTNYGSEVWLWHGNTIHHVMPCLSAGGEPYKFPLPTGRHFI